MSKREKIIVAIMAATVLIGGYLFVGPVPIGSQGEMEKQLDGPTLDVAQKILQTLKADTSLTKDLFTVRSAERKWEKDPFLKSSKLLSDTHKRETTDRTAASASTRSEMIYTGFLEVGSQRLAIINGIEYALGEAIDGQGHYLRRIHPHQVEIGKQNAPGILILKLMEYESITRK